MISMSEIPTSSHYKLTPILSRIELKSRDFEGCVVMSADNQSITQTLTRREFLYLSVFFDVDLPAIAAVSSSLAHIRQVEVAKLILNPVFTVRQAFYTPISMTMA